MGYCTLKENIIDGDACPRCVEELKRLLAVEAAAHRALHLLTARATTALPPSAMMLAYNLAFEELRDGVSGVREGGPEMRPHEETWTADPVQIAAAQTGAMINFGNGACAHLRGEANTMPPPMSEITPERLYERAKLMAAAPEMARMLLALHDEHGDRHTFDWAYWFDEIEEVLVRAGVLP